METDEQKWERRTLLDSELRERFNIAPNWPERIDWETGETYHPGMRYLERLWKRQRAQRGEALMAAVRSVIAEERSGAWVRCPCWRRS